MVLILNALSRLLDPKAFALEGQNGITNHNTAIRSPSHQPTGDWIAPPKRHARSSADKDQETQIKKCSVQVRIRELGGHVNGRNFRLPQILELYFGRCSRLAEAPGVDL